MGRVHSWEVLGEFLQVNVGDGSPSLPKHLWVGVAVQLGIETCSQHLLRTVTTTWGLDR